MRASAGRAGYCHTFTREGIECAAVGAAEEELFDPPGEVLPAVGLRRKIAAGRRDRLLYRGLDFLGRHRGKLVRLDHPLYRYGYVGAEKAVAPFRLRSIRSRDIDEHEILIYLAEESARPCGEGIGRSVDRHPALGEDVDRPALPEGLHDAGDRFYVGRKELFRDDPALRRQLPEEGTPRVKLVDDDHRSAFEGEPVDIVEVPEGGVVRHQDVGLLGLFEVAGLERQLLAVSSEYVRDPEQRRVHHRVGSPVIVLEEHLLKEDPDQREEGGRAEEDDEDQKTDRYLIHYEESCSVSHEDRRKDRGDDSGGDRQDVFAVGEL